MNKPSFKQQLEEAGLTEEQINLVITVASKRVLLEYGRWRDTEIMGAAACANLLVWFKGLDKES